MPAAFMEDQSVPARWRVLGIINGFAIAGKSFYGSNEWLMEQLGCSEPTVTKAIADLEALGEIQVVRTKRSRVVYRTMRDPNQLGSRPKPTLVSDPNQLGPNSDSNSDNIIGEASASPEYEVVPDEPPKRPKPDRSVEQVYAVFFELTGRPTPANWRLNKTQRQAAKNLIEERKLPQVRKALLFALENHDDPYCPFVYTPYDLDSKWESLKNYRDKHGNQ